MLDGPLEAAMDEGRNTVTYEARFLRAQLQQVLQEWYSFNESLGDFYRWNKNHILILRWHKVCLLIECDTMPGRVRWN